MRIETVTVRDMEGNDEFFSMSPDIVLQISMMTMDLAHCAARQRSRQEDQAGIGRTLEAGGLSIVAACRRHSLSLTRSTGSQRGEEWWI